MDDSGRRRAAYAWAAVIRRSWKPPRAAFVRTRHLTDATSEREILEMYRQQRPAPRLTPAET